MGARRRKRSYGSGQVVPPRVTGGTWAIKVREGGKRRYRGGFPTRDLAERALAKIAGEVAAYRAGIPQDPKAAPTLGSLVDDFLKRRELTHRAAECDKYRWKKHLAAEFAHLRPAAVDTARIRAFVEGQLRDGLSPGTIRIHVALLSSLFSDLIERGIATSNPAKALPLSLSRMMRPTHDPRTTPFIERLGDVKRIYADLPSPLNVAYAIGALGGLRTGEVFALRWASVDLEARRIHVRESVKGPTKDKDSRVVPILDALLPVLKAWRLKTGGEGLVVPPLRKDAPGSKTGGRAGHVGKGTPGKALRTTLERLDLSRPGLGWYEATRHTFASQWVLNGGSIEKLKEILGHYSVVMTERYTHLRPDLFAARDLGTIALDLRPGSAGELGRDWADRAEKDAASPRRSAGAAL